MTLVFNIHFKSHGFWFNGEGHEIVLGMVLEIWITGWSSGWSSGWFLRWSLGWYSSHGETCFEKIPNWFTVLVDWALCLNWHIDLCLLIFKIL